MGLLNIQAYSHTMVELLEGEIKNSHEQTDEFSYNILLKKLSIKNNADVMNFSFSNVRTENWQGNKVYFGTQITAYPHVLEFAFILNSAENALAITNPYLKMTTGCDSFLWEFSSGQMVILKSIFNRF